MSLAEVKRILDKIAEESSTNGKVQIIKQNLNNVHFDRVCHYALNPFYSYNIREITPSAIRPRKPSIASIFSFLDKLRSQRGATDIDRGQLSTLSSIDFFTIEIVNRILKKDLRCGASAKLFNKAGMDIPQHEVCLCIDNFEKFKKHAKTLDNMCWSLKLDGVRVWAVIQPTKEIKYISRNGKEYPNFSIFDEEVWELRRRLIAHHEFKESTVVILDGEVISKEKDFQKQMQNVRRLKDADISKFEFHIFDHVISCTAFSKRYEILNMCVVDFDRIFLVEHEIPASEEEIFKILDEVTDQGEEGLILKTWSDGYQFKRTNAWCKLKKFHTEDLPVIGWEYGEGKYSDVLGVLLVKRGDVVVKVGSGFSDKERKLFMTETPKMIEVKYQEVTKDGSLRFPTLVCVRDDK